MIAKAICRAVDRITRDGRDCLVITASLDEAPLGAPGPPPDERSLDEAKAKMAELNIGLGGTMQTRRAAKKSEYPTGPTLIVPDDDSMGGCIFAEHVDVLELSVGGVVFQLFVLL